MGAETGQVAPDFKPKKHFNALRVMPEYRMTLEMGSIEDLFKHEPGEKKGRMERLQALGLFYFPLEHPKATERFDKCWDWVKTKIFKVADDPAADAMIQDALKCRIVSGSAPPAWNSPSSGLPTDAADPANPAAENFAKFRIPGAYTVLWGAGGESLNTAGKYHARFSTNKLFGYESTFYDENPALRKLPLVAKVEKRLKESDPWMPAEGVSVHFQLLPPYALPAFDGTAASSAQFNRPPLGDNIGGPTDAAGSGGPKKKIDAEEAKHAAPTDPQTTNAHHSRGGERGHGSLDNCTDVAGPVFHVKSFPGFNKKGKRELPHKDYPVAEKAKPVGDKHKHAVKAKTNEDGEAGVLFKPSRCGGDRYRLRAYIGPPSSASDGVEPGAVQVTTGTFVVWRNLRISQYFHQAVSAAPDAALVNDAVNWFYATSAANYLQLASCHDGTNFVGLDSVRLDDPDSSRPSVFASLPLHFAPAWLEVEQDQAGPILLTDAQWKAARRLGVDDGKKHQGKVGLNLDLEKLFVMDLDFPAADTICNLTMRTPEGYNALVPAGKQIALPLSTNTQQNVEALCERFVLNGFMRSLTNDGALPGLTLIYGGMGYSWLLFNGSHYSGIVQDYRGSFLWYGADTYKKNWKATSVATSNFTYDCTSNACHELGHAMFQAHAPPTSPASHISGRHDPQAECMCVMSYGNCIGEYCGFTLLSFRGWDVP